MDLSYAGKYAVGLTFREHSVMLFPSAADPSLGGWGFDGLQLCERGVLVPAASQLQEAQASPA